MIVSEIFEWIDFYESHYRHPDMPRFERSGLYDLFPEQPVIAMTEIAHQWPEQWPLCGQAGVYLFLDNELNALYVGKANHLGMRLQGYCGYNRDRTCNLLDTWHGAPRFVVTIGIPAATWFENTSLESFLIEKIAPANNIKK